eukprot:11139924-Alexandrium_andersonii.AAC.1
MGRERSDKATLDAASRRPMLLCDSNFALSTASVRRQPREGSEGPVWRGVVPHMGRLGDRSAARVATYPELERLGRHPCTVSSP